MFLHGNYVRPNPYFIKACPSDCTVPVFAFIFKVAMHKYYRIIISAREFY